MARLDVRRDRGQENGSQSDSRRIIDLALKSMQTTARTLTHQLGQRGDRWQALMALPCAVVWLNRRGWVAQCNSKALQVLGGPLLGRRWRAVLEAGIVRDTDEGLFIGSTRYTLSGAPFDGGQLLIFMPIPEAAPQADSRQIRLAELGQLAAGLAHQLRTPLATAQLYLDLARETSRLELLNEVQTALDSLNRHSETLLTFARGGIAVESSMDCGQWCDDLKRQVLAIAKQERSVVFRCRNSQVPFACNHHLLIGASLNLIENALQASQPGQQVQVTWRSNGDQLRMLVLDRGRGAPEDIVADPGRAFASGREGGTGLGLTMARLIAKAHGGGLELRRRRRGGTCVSLWVKSLDRNNEVLRGASEIQ